MSWELAKTITQTLYYLVAALAAIGALLVYRNNSRRERARWAESLYTRFLSGRSLKQYGTSSIVLSEMRRWFNWSMKNRRRSPIILTFLSL